MTLLSDKKAEAEKPKWHAQNKWNWTNRDKLRAQWAVRRAIEAGKLRRGKCEVCGSLRVDAHHDDYSRPLDVRWLCRRHHQQHHAALRVAK